MGCVCLCPSGKGVRQRAQAVAAGVVLNFLRHHRLVEGPLRVAVRPESANAPRKHAPLPESFVRADPAPASGACILLATPHPIRRTKQGAGDRRGRWCPQPAPGRVEYSGLPYARGVRGRRHTERVRRCQTHRTGFRAGPRRDANIGPNSGAPSSATCPVLSSGVIWTGVCVLTHVRWPCPVKAAYANRLSPFQRPVCTF